MQSRTRANGAERLLNLKAATEIIDGRPWASLSGTTQKTATAIKVKVWFDSQTHLPQRVFADDGQVQVTMNFTVTKGAPHVAAFAARPPPGLPKRRQEPEYPRVKHGQTAPAFSLRTPKGKATSLSQCKGKFVLLEFCKGRVKRTWKFYLPGATETRLHAYVGELVDEPKMEAQ